ISRRGRPAGGEASASRARSASRAVRASRTSARLLSLDLAVAPGSLDAAAQGLGLGDRPGERLQAIDRPTIRRAFEHAVVAALQGFVAAHELVPAGFGLRAVRVGADLYADPGHGRRIDLFAVDARLGHDAAVGDPALHRLALG